MITRSGQGRSVCELTAGHLSPEPAPQRHRGEACHRSMVSRCKAPGAKLRALTSTWVCGHVQPWMWKSTGQSRDSCPGGTGMIFSCSLAFRCLLWETSRPGRSGLPPRPADLSPKPQLKLQTSYGLESERKHPSTVLSI